MKRIFSSPVVQWMNVFFAVIAVVLMYQIAQAAQRPSCTLFNDGPVTVSNGTATLAYTTQEHPTSVTISPSVSGTPQLGAPDPERSDYLQMGQIATRAITKDTRFEMTVSNSAGSSRCSSTVYYKPMPSGGWDVPLVSQEPVFRRTDIPDGYDNSGGYYPFLGMQWISGGYFVVSGNGNSTALGSLYKTKPDKLESGGMYVFNESGSLLGVRNVAFDTTGTRTACFEGGGCTAGWIIHPTGQGRFVRDLHPQGTGHTRSPVQYSVSSGVSLLNRLFFNQTAANYGNEITVSSGPQEYSHVAIADGKMFGIGSRYDGLFDRGGEHALEIYDLNFTFLGKYSKSYTPPSGSGGGASPRTVPVFTPLVGVGNYILGTPDDKFTHNGAGLALVRSSAPLNVYRAPTLQEIDNQTPIQKIQTIEPPSSGSNVVRFAYDSANTNRIALFWGSSENRGTLDVYEVGSNGLQRVVRRPMTNPFFQTMAVGSQSGFAVSGEYVVYGTCSDRSGFDGGTGGKRFDSCEVVVEDLESGDKLSVEPLPDADQFIYDLESLPRAQSPNSFAISPSGKILVSGLAESDWGNLYLYQIGGVSLPPTGTTGGGSVPFDLTFTAQLAENILRVIGSGSCPTVTNQAAYQQAVLDAARNGYPLVREQFFDCVFSQALGALYANPPR